MAEDTEERTWFTAGDDEVCSVCAEFDRRSVGGGENFRSEDGSVNVFKPPAHEGCRCGLLASSWEIRFDEEGDSSGLSPAAERLYEDLEVLTEALSNPDAAPNARLTLLERIQKQVKRPEANGLGYQYYLSDYNLNRDFAEAYLGLSRFEEAVPHAVAAGRFDLAGDALWRAGRQREALDNFSRSDFNFSKIRLLQMLRMAQVVFGDDAAQDSTRNEYPSIHSKVVQRFGNWESASIQATHKAGKLEPDPSQISHLSAGTVTDVNHLLELAASKVGQVQDESSLLEEARSLVRDGKLQKAEAVYRELQSASSQFEYEARRDLYEVLLLQERQKEVLEALRGKYLSTDLDFYLNLKLISGEQLTGEDLIVNFYWAIEDRSQLFEKLQSAFVEFGEKQVGSFEQKHGAPVLSYVADRLSVSERVRNWADELYLDPPGKNLIGILNFFDFSREEEFLETVKGLVRPAEREVRASLGISETEVKWISEFSLFRYVQERLSGYGVIQHAVPKWLSPQHLDVFVPELKIAFEYMGRQHYEPVEFFGGQEGFESVRKRDRRKTELCGANSVRLIHVRFDETWEKVDEAIKLAMEDS